MRLYRRRGPHWPDPATFTGRLDLVRARVRAGLLTGQVAARLGVSDSAVSAWERGWSVPTADRHGEYAAILGISRVALEALLDQPIHRPARAGHPTSAAGAA